MVEDKKEEPKCTVVESILNEPFNLEEGQESLFELEQRKKINKHISECKTYGCYLIKIDRINKGLY